MHGKSISGKRTVVITGANSGIGRQAANSFAAAGHRVFMACRDEGKAERAKAAILAAHPGAELRVMNLDMASAASILFLCERLEKEVDAVDAIIHNAGSFNFSAREFQTTDAGVEMTFFVNSVATLLMDLRLRSLLRASSDPRIVNASSLNIVWFRDKRRAIDYGSLTEADGRMRPYSVYKLYGDSKMSLCLLTHRLAEEFMDDGIAVNALIIPDVRHDRESLRKMGGLPAFLSAIVNPFLPPQDLPAEAYLRLVEDDQLRGMTGRLLDCSLKDFNAPAYAHDGRRISENWEFCRAVCDPLIEGYRSEQGRRTVT